MQLASVNVGSARPIRAKSGWTGIHKHPVTGPVQVAPSGLAGDTICDTDNHGGLDQAVYLYGTPDYAWWSEELGRPLAPGTFGENLTVRGLHSADLLVGDRLSIGEVLLEVTCPRVPCVTLAVRMGDPGFLRRFRAAERPGAYCRVLRTGTLRAGDVVLRQAYTGEPVTVLEVLDAFFDPHASEATLRRQLTAPLAERARRDTQARLPAVQSGSDAPATARTVGEG